jgi:hypothetical protein
VDLLELVLPCSLAHLWRCFSGVDWGDGDNFLVLYVIKRVCCNEFVVRENIMPDDCKPFNFPGGVEPLNKFKGKLLYSFGCEASLFLGTSDDFIKHEEIYRSASNIK